MRVADHVFEALSRAILSGELAPGSALATQPELARQFSVSPLIVRQATYRLEELGLVRVRQGSATTVLDPSEASDVRLMQLQLELATPNDRLGLAASESYALSTLPILELAQRRITEVELQRLERIIDSLPEDVTHEPAQFVVALWAEIARATHNPVIEQQVRWWTHVMQRLEERGMGIGPRRRLPTAVYRGLVRALRRRRGAPELWLKTIAPLFDWTESQPAHVFPRRRSKSPSDVQETRSSKPRRSTRRRRSGSVTSGCP